MTATMSTIVAALAVILYLLSGALLALRLWRGEPDSGSAGRGVLALAAGAVLLHAGQLYPRVVTPEGLNFGFFNALSLVSWLIALLLLLSMPRRPVANLGIVLFPWAGLNIVLDLGLPSHRIIPAAAPWQLQVHILISVLAYSLLAIAMVQALLLALQERQLRRRRPGRLVRALPPMQTMETLLFEMIGLGFAFLSLSLVTGMLFLEDMFARHLVHKTVLSIAAWLIFATLLWGRRHFGWRGRTAIRWTLGGFFTLALAYFGSKLVLELILRT